MAARHYKVSGSWFLVSGFLLNYSRYRSYLLKAPIIGQGH
jgi:hypothetical protein